MVLKPGEKLVVLKPTVVKKLEEYYKSGTIKAPDFTNFVNELLLMNVEKDAFLRKYAPKLAKVAYEDNILFIKDFELDRTVEIYLRDHHLYCNLDNSKDCVHIHYALALPEVGRLQIRRPSKSDTEAD